MQTATFGAKFKALKKAVEDSILIQYHIISMGINVSKPTPVFMDDMSVETPVPPVVSIALNTL